MPATASDSPLFQYTLKNNGAAGLRDPLISVDADFTPAAFPLNDSAGRPLGLIATMDRAPMRDALLAESLLRKGLAE